LVDEMVVLQAGGVFFGEVELIVDVFVANATK
jgi:hypothetical protein